MNFSPDSLSYGNATENDFVLVDDPRGESTLDAGAVRGYAQAAGTDGVIRAIRSFDVDPSLREAGARVPEWFMDYRNADGSIAQMCGNGVRAYVAFLRDRGYETSDSFDVMTRAGVRHVDVLSVGPEWSVRVGMGPARIDGPQRKVRVGERWLDSTDINMGNPHTVVQLPSDIPLESLDLSVKPELDPEPEEGTNIEFVEPRSERHVAMRVYERGVGETKSCGTGATAVAVATALARGDQSQEPWRIDVLGGVLTIGWDESGEMTLTGPATLGELDPASGAPVRD